MIWGIFFVVEVSRYGVLVVSVQYLLTAIVSYNSRKRTLKITSGVFQFSIILTTYSVYVIYNGSRF